MEHYVQLFPIVSWPKNLFSSGEPSFSFSQMLEAFANHQNRPDDKRRRVSRGLDIQQRVPRDDAAAHAGTSFAIHMR